MIEIKQLSKHYPATASHKKAKPATTPSSSAAGTIATSTTPPIAVSIDAQTTALNNINVQIKKGEIFGFIGKSGAGKSTLLHCMTLLEQPSSGQVLIDGVDITALPSHELRQQRRKIGMIFQSFNLLQSQTVYNNIALPLRFSGHSKQEIEQRVLPLLDLVQLSDRKDHYPAQLSGGQKQRIAIARALACQPKVLFCDEATSALDPQTTATILDLLQDINQKLDLTIVLITHEMEVIKNICDRVAILEDGKIIEQSKTIDLFTNPQTATAKTFVSSCLQQDLPPDLPFIIYSTPAAVTEPTNPLLRISFFGEATSEPILTTMIKKFDLSLNMLQATIEHISHDIMGIMIVEILNNHQHLPEITAFLSGYGLRSEVIGYVATDRHRSS